MRRKLRKLKIREVSFCAKGQNPESHIRVVKAAAPVDIREPIHGPIVLTGEQRRLANEWAAQVLKSREIQKEQTMTNTPQTTAAIVKAYMDRHDVSEAEAFAKVSTRPEFAQAYENEVQSGHVARMVADRVRTYGA